MNLVFHCLAGAGIGHVAASRFPEPGRSALPVIACAAAVSFLSHGVLDGLKHGYPFSPRADIFLALAMATVWCLAVRRRFALLFAAVFTASFLPDIADLGPSLLKSAAGIDLHLGGQRIFPWHWADGSGSMFPSASNAPERFKILDLGQNRAVSAANHAIILFISAAGILSNLSVFRRILRSPVRETV